MQFKKNKMKIAFCGDSFCMDATKNLYPTYPYLVGKEFNAEVLGLGMGGCALFHSYELMMENIDESDYIIFCVTESARLPNKYRASATSMTPTLLDIDNKWDYFPNDDKFYKTLPSKKDMERFSEGVRLYYTDIMPWKFHKVAQRGILREMDAVIKEYNKKCIFLESFSLSFCDYTFENAVWGNLSLYHDISLPEEEFMTKEELNILRNNADFRANHMNEQNNRNMANFIIDVIKKDDFTPRELDMKEYGFSKGK